MSKEKHELPPPRMFPRTEGQAKFTVFLVLFAAAAALAYGTLHGVTLGE